MDSDDAKHADAGEAQPATSLPAHVQLSMETISELHARTESELNNHQRWIERATLEMGHPRSFYIIVGAAAAWIAWNTGVAGWFQLAAPDPFPFVAMQGTLSFLALLVATMVLTTQNRLGRRADNRSHLDLQINLLAERKITKLIQLVEELRVDLPMVRNRLDPVAEAMQNPADSRAVVDALAPPKRD